MTIFEKIKNSTVENLASWINDELMNQCAMCDEKCHNGGTREECINGISKWLNKETE